MSEYAPADIDKHVRGWAKRYFSELIKKDIRSKLTALSRDQSAYLTPPGRPVDPEEIPF